MISLVVPLKMGEDLLHVKGRLIYLLKIIFKLNFGMIEFLFLFLGKNKNITTLKYY